MQIWTVTPGFTPGKAEQPLQHKELQEKEVQKRLKHGNLFRKNLRIKGFY